MMLGTQRCRDMQLGERRAYESQDWRVFLDVTVISAGPMSHGSFYQSTCRRCCGFGVAFISGLLDRVQSLVDYHRENP